MCTSAIVGALITALAIDKVVSSEFGFAMEHITIRTTERKWILHGSQRLSRMDRIEVEELVAKVDGH